MFVAPRMRTPLESRPTPSIWTRSSVLIRRDASDSPSPLGPHSASTSSMKMMEGLFSLAMLNSCFTNLLGMSFLGPLLDVWGEGKSSGHTVHFHPSIWRQDHYY